MLEKKNRNRASSRPVILYNPSNGISEETHRVERVPDESERGATVRQSVDSTDLRTHFRPAVRCVGFWTAALLPFVLVTLLAGGTIIEWPFVAGGLLAVNPAGLVLGREHVR